MNEQDYSMGALLEVVREAVRDAVSEAGKDYDEDELAWEIAESFVPIYNYDVLQYAIHNLDLALTVPDSQPYEQDAVGIITANMFDECYAVALEEIENIRNETGTRNESEG